MPVTSSDSTGVMDMPPADPAAAATVWVSLEDEENSTEDNGSVMQLSENGEELMVDDNDMKATLKRIK